MQEAAGLQQALASGQHHGAVGGGLVPSLAKIIHSPCLGEVLEGQGPHVSILQSPPLLGLFFSPTRFSSRVFGATYRHWGRGHQFHSQESLTSAHRVTKGTQPSECHLSAGGCGVLYQATGEGLGWYS